MVESGEEKGSIALHVSRGQAPSLYIQNLLREIFTRCLENLVCEDQHYCAVQVYACGAYSSHILMPYSSPESTNSIPLGNMPNYWMIVFESGPEQTSRCPYEANDCEGDLNQCDICDAE